MTILPVHLAVYLAFSREALPVGLSWGYSMGDMTAPR